MGGVRGFGLHIYYSNSSMVISNILGRLLFWCFMVVDVKVFTI